MDKAILFIGGALALIYLRARNILNRLAYKIAGVQLVSFSADEIKLNLNLLINNPTNITAQIGQFVADVYINDQLVGNINYPVNRYLTSGVNNITVGVVFNSKTAGEVIWQQLQSGNIYNMAMDIEGQMMIDNSKFHMSARFLLQDFWNFAK